MLALTRPSATTIANALARRREMPHNYGPVGATRAKTIPAGWVVDHHRIKLGHGKRAFQAAYAAVEAWEMFDIQGMAISNGTAMLPSIRSNASVMVLAKALFFWTLNPARITYVMDDSCTFGFGYGTLPGNSLQGEERFRIEWRADEDDSVWYDVLAFSRPMTPEAIIGYPYVRWRQLRFGGHLTLDAMVNAVGRRMG